MITDFHFLRPMFLFALIPLLGLSFLLWRQRPKLLAWDEICDPHLLAHLEQKKGGTKSLLSLMTLFFSVFFMILALAGPSWFKFPVATYKQIHARVLVLDMSESMMKEDLSPNRLSRAKFKLHDLFTRKELGQFGLVVFTGEPFVVSPLTEDGKTIASLLPTLTTDIMPVSGHQLDTALSEASQLIKTAGFKRGQVLVLTAESPSTASIQMAKKLADAGIFSSVMPITAEKPLNPLFQEFAKAGGGQLLTYTADSSDLDHWLKQDGEKQFILNKDDNLPVWRDEGRWFLIPALTFLLPVFRRGWLQKVAI